MSIGWFILIALALIVIGTLAAFSSIKFDFSHEARRSPIIFRLVIIWPSGPVTYEWPKPRD